MSSIPSVQIKYVWMVNNPIYFTVMFLPLQRCYDECSYSIVWVKKCAKSKISLYAMCDALDVCPQNCIETVYIVNISNLNESGW